MSNLWNIVRAIVADCEDHGHYLPFVWQKQESFMPSEDGYSYGPVSISKSVIDNVISAISENK